MLSNVCPRANKSLEYSNKIKAYLSLINKNCKGNLVCCSLQPANRWNIPTILKPEMERKDGSGKSLEFSNDFKVQNSGS